MTNAVRTKRELNPKLINYHNCKNKYFTVIIVY